MSTEANSKTIGVRFGAFDFGCLKLTLERRLAEVERHGRIVGAGEDAGTYAGQLRGCLRAIEEARLTWLNGRPGLGLAEEQRILAIGGPEATLVRGLFYIACFETTRERPIADRQACVTDGNPPEQALARLHDNFILDARETLQRRARA